MLEKKLLQMRYPCEKAIKAYISINRHRSPPLWRVSPSANLVTSECLPCQVFLKYMWLGAEREFFLRYLIYFDFHLKCKRKSCTRHDFLRLTHGIRSVKLTLLKSCLCTKTKVVCLVGVGFFGSFGLVFVLTDHSIYNPQCYPVKCQLQMDESLIYISS